MFSYSIRPFNGKIHIKKFVWQKEKKKEFLIEAESRVTQCSRERKKNKTDWNFEGRKNINEKDEIDTKRNGYWKQKNTAYDINNKGEYTMNWVNNSKQMHRERMLEIYLESNEATVLISLPQCTCIIETCIRYRTWTSFFFF